ncbi:PH domain-containing protein [Microbacterium sp. gxy059]|uniref:PH domain-containing protein n=1 Tax=Microbacterium sp. gxy059 TaxID=2957199 RepID=UPI003D9825EB
MTGPHPGAPEPEDAAVRQDEGAPASALPGGGSSSLVDGEWHRLHPLTPLFKGGLVLLVVAGIVLNSMRDRVIYWFVSFVAPAGELEDDAVDYGELDPLDWIFANNLILIALLVTLVLVAAFILGYWMVWRFHQFRVTGESVEVKKGIIFRSQRQAPLDRVQGVNLTRPFPARLIGMAKLTLEGAGTGADVALEYLSANRAERVRSDILRLASGARAAKEERRTGQPARPRDAHGRVIDTVSENVTNIVHGVDQDDVVPESLVKIPVGRLIASQAITGFVWLVFFGLIVVFAVLLPIYLTEDGPERTVILLSAGLGTAIPMVFATFAIVWSALQKGFRFAIAPTPDGLRVTSGMLTTVTRTIPPGRVHAVEVTQNLLWRPFGWWSVRINRMGGGSAAQQNSSQAQQNAVILPVGTRADVERVVGLLLPDAPAQDALFTWEHGILGPQPQDPFTTTPKRARIWHPLAWNRRGVRVTSYAVLLRRGLLLRRLAVFPLARLQGVSVRQGPIARGMGLAAMQIHVVPGPISGDITSLDREDAQRFAYLVIRGAVAAAESDHTHRWAEEPVRS